MWEWFCHASAARWNHFGRRERGEGERESECFLFFFFFFSMFSSFLFASSTGTVCILQTYSKTRALTRSERPIWRFVPHELGRLLVLFLSYVKPIEATFTHEMYSAEASEIVRHHLFVKFGQRFTADNIRDTVSAALSRQFNDQVMFSAYRYLWRLFLFFFSRASTSSSTSGTLPLDSCGFIAKPCLT